MRSEASAFAAMAAVAGNVRESVIPARVCQIVLIRSFGGCDFSRNAPLGNEISPKTFVLQLA